MRHVGYRLPSTLVVEVRRLLAAGEPFVYAYYDGIDKVAHEYGLGEHYDAELAAADRLVADVRRRAARRTPRCWSPPTTARSTSATDVVDARRRACSTCVALPVGRGPVPLAARPPGAGAEPCWTPPTAAHGDVAWVVPVEQVARRGLVRARG